MWGSTQLTLDIDTVAEARYLSGIVTQIEILGPADSQGSYYRYEC